uniref:Uncharacterized protein n=1 Tax=Anguilla anguilla TaxID=7936 RepID=A0A0E9XT76_ANGAN
MHNAGISLSQWYQFFL